jgi:hypothetical protein
LKNGRKQSDSQVKMRRISQKKKKTAKNKKTAPIADFFFFFEVESPFFLAENKANENDY